MQADAVVHTVEVALDADRAFALWHERIDLWWPASHRLSGDPTARMQIEPRVGGLLVERTRDGREFEWGEVERWEPPRRIVHSWLPGALESEPSSVDITFAPLAGHGTLITVTHVPGAMSAERWNGAKERFVSGWTTVLAEYREEASANES